MNQVKRTHEYPEDPTYCDGTEWVRGAMKNAQDFFNEVVQRLAAQGGTSIDEDSGMCAYRGVGGRRCAVGWLIDEGAYSIGIEGAELGLASGCVNRALKSSGLDVSDSCLVRMLASLQEIHDNMEVEDWPDAFRGAGMGYGLSTVVVDYAFRGAV